MSQESRQKLNLRLLSNALSSERTGNGDMLHAGRTKGSSYLDLREQWHILLRSGFDVYPFGAVVPLMETYRYADLFDVIIAAKKDWTLLLPFICLAQGIP